MKQDIRTALFSRIPKRFAALLTPGDEEAILQVATEVIGSAKRGVAIQKIPHRAAILVGLTDRPFIVNTISETVRAHHGRLLVLLHPVLTVGESTISLCYLEFSTLPQPALDAFCLRLQENLNTLTEVTSDFDTMRGMLHRAMLSTSPHSESAAFTDWLVLERFVFVGAIEWELEGGNASAVELLGQAKISSTQSNSEQLRLEAKLDIESLTKSGEPISITTLSVPSVVHRHRRLLHVAVYNPASPKSAYSVVGLLTSSALLEETSDAPLVRKKIAAALSHEIPGTTTHDMKSVLSLVDRMPKDAALRLDKATFAELIRCALETQETATATAVVHYDARKRGATIALLIPRERYYGDTRERLQRYLEETFQVPHSSIEFYPDIGRKSVARLYFYVPLSATSPLPEPTKLREALALMSLSWDDQLGDALALQPELASIAAGITFPRDYQIDTEVAVAIEEISALAEISSRRPLAVLWRPIAQEQGEATFAFTVLSRDKELSISSVVPKLEHLALDVQSAATFCLIHRSGNPVYVQRFTTKPRSGKALPSLSRAARETLSDLFLGEELSDSLGGLLLTTELPPLAIKVFRAYCQLLAQTNRSVSKKTINLSLAESAVHAQILWQIFAELFETTSTSADESAEQKAARVERAQQIHATYLHELRSIRSAAQDRVLRQLAQLVLGTVRTNAFTETPRALAIKLLSEQIDFLPSPRPKFEIFVTSARIEACHLRMGSVARGGIRWSDRDEDFRTEVLGLVKTQRVKNVLIVPTGSKGGFIARNLPVKAEERPAAVQEAYREYIRALLSVTDNRRGDRIVPPLAVIRHDGDDPYLVVAADKGTATFSDIANQIATKEFGFWLGDAFASGGSQGYDHKKYGITARGAWECTKRHFLDLGLDYQQPFSVIGIGDMAGDVFGNGLLMSNRMKLLGAFNHAHIFVDPDPSPEKSFVERERLFKLPRSQWSDYNKELISRGGGVFDRFEKEIRVTPEMRFVFSIPDSAGATVSGEQLIHHMLQAPVDLLWNGGIGTYVKASFETHRDASDERNDAVRVDGKMLRCKVVAEGGNLGFTQQGRIEFAEHGGRLNTDAIDNSGGVDMSDHEVNLKIFLGGMMQNGGLSLAERDALLREVGNDVSEHILSHNRAHAHILTMNEARSKTHLDDYAALLRMLVRLGYLNRSLDALPDDETLRERRLKQQGLTRPELALLLAGTKMWAKELLLASSLKDEAWLLGFAVEYFPQAMQKKFGDALRKHPLASHIAATELVDYTTRLFGLPFLPLLIEREGVPFTKALTVLAEVVTSGARELQNDLLARESAGSLKGGGWFVLLQKELERLVSAGIRVSSTTSEIAELPTLMRAAQAALADKEDRFTDSLVEQGLPREVAASIAVLRSTAEVLPLLPTAEKKKIPLEKLLATYTTLSIELRMSELSTARQNYLPLDSWEGDLLRSSDLQLERALASLAASRMHCSPHSAELKEFGSWIVSLRTFSDEILLAPFKPAAFAVFASKATEAAQAIEQF